MKFKYVIICFIIYIHKFISTHGSIYKNEVFRDYVAEEPNSNGDKFDVNSTTKIEEIESSRQEDENIINNNSQFNELSTEINHDSDISEENFQKTTTNDNADETNETNVNNSQFEKPMALRQLYQGQNMDSAKYDNNNFVRNYTTLKNNNQNLKLNISAMTFEQLKSILKNRYKEKIVTNRIINKEVSNDNLKKNSKKISTKLKEPKGKSFGKDKKYYESDQKMVTRIYNNSTIRPLQELNKTNRINKQTVQNKPDVNSLVNVETDHYNISVQRKTDKTPKTKGPSTEEIQIKFINEDTLTTEPGTNPSSTDEDLPLTKSDKNTLPSSSKTSQTTILYDKTSPSSVSEDLEDKNTLSSHISSKTTQTTYDKTTPSSISDESEDKSTLLSHSSSKNNQTTILNDKTTPNSTTDEVVIEETKKITKRPVTCPHKIVISTKSDVSLKKTEQTEYSTSTSESETNGYNTSSDKTGDTGTYSTTTSEKSTNITTTEILTKSSLTGNTKKFGDIEISKYPSEKLETTTYSSTIPEENSPFVKEKPGLTDTDKLTSTEKEPKIVSSTQKTKKICLASSRKYEKTTSNGDTLSKTQSEDSSTKNLKTTVLTETTASTDKTGMSSNSVDTKGTSSVIESSGNSDKTGTSSYLVSTTGTSSETESSGNGDKTKKSSNSVDTTGTSSETESSGNGDKTKKSSNSVDTTGTSSVTESSGNGDKTKKSSYSVDTTGTSSVTESSGNGDKMKTSSSLVSTTRTSLVTESSENGEKKKTPSSLVDTSGTSFVTDSLATVDKTGTPSYVIDSRGISFATDSVAKTVKSEKPYVVKIFDHNSKEIKGNISVTQEFAASVHKAIEVTTKLDKISETTAVPKLSSSFNRSVKITSSMATKSFNNHSTSSVPTADNNKKKKLVPKNNLWLKLKLYNLPSHRRLSVDHVFTTSEPTKNVAPKPEKLMEKFEKMLPKSEKLGTNPEKSVHVFKLDGNSGKLDNSIGDISKIIKEKIIFEKLKDLKTQFKDLKTKKPGNVKSQERLSHVKVGNFMKQQTKRFMFNTIKTGGENKGGKNNNNISFWENYSKKVNLKLTFKNNSMFSLMLPKPNVTDTGSEQNDNAVNHQHYKVAQSDDEIDYEIPTVKTDNETFRRDLSVGLTSTDKIIINVTEPIGNNIQINVTRNSNELIGGTLITNTLQQRMNLSSGRFVNAFSTISAKTLIASSTSMQEKLEDNKSDNVSITNQLDVTKCILVTTNENPPPEQTSGDEFLKCSEIESTISQDDVTKCEATTITNPESTICLTNTTQQFETTKCNVTTSTCNPVVTNDINISTICPPVSCKPPKLDKDPDYYCAFTTTVLPKLFYNNQRMAELSDDYYVNKTTSCSTIDCNLQCPTTCIDDEKLDMGDEVPLVTKKTSKTATQSKHTGTGNNFFDEGHVSITDWTKAEIEGKGKTQFREMLSTIFPKESITTGDVKNTSSTLANGENALSNLSESCIPIETTISRATFECLTSSATSISRPTPSCISDGGVTSTIDSNNISTNTCNNVSLAHSTVTNILDNSTMDFTTELSKNISGRIHDSTNHSATKRNCKENSFNVNTTLTNEESITANAVASLVEDYDSLNEKINIKSHHSTRLTVLDSSLKNSTPGNLVNTTTAVAKVEQITSKNLASNSTKQFIIKVQGNNSDIFNSLPKVVKVVGGEGYVSNFINSVFEKQLKEIIVNLRIADSINVNGSLQCVYVSQNKK